MTVQLVFKISNLCDPDPPTSQTDGRTTCNLNTALCTSASRGKKTDNRQLEIATWSPKPELVAAMIDRIEISGGFLTTAISIKVYPNNCDNDRHPEMELQLHWRSTCNLVLIFCCPSTPSLTRSLAASCWHFFFNRNRRAWSKNENAEICPSSRDINISDLGGHMSLSPVVLVAVAITLKLFRALRCRKHPICSWNFNVVCYNFSA